MKLRNKLVIAQLCVFLVIMGILLTALPELVYRNISVKDREDTMILNEQIMSQLDQNFEELVRFTKIVAEEPELIQKIDQYCHICRDIERHMWQQCQHADKYTFYSKL